MTIPGGILPAPGGVSCGEPISALGVSAQAQILNLPKDLRDFSSCIFVAHGHIDAPCGRYGLKLTPTVWWDVPGRLEPVGEAPFAFSTGSRARPTIQKHVSTTGRVRARLEVQLEVERPHRVPGCAQSTRPAPTRPRVSAFAQRPFLIDMAPTILAALDVPASIRHTGRVLHEIVGAEASVRAGEAVPTSEAASTEPTVTDTEADEMEEHLRGLGYLE